VFRLMGYYAERGPIFSLITTVCNPAVCFHTVSTLHPLLQMR